jgi:8-oxo-dGTP pyrophosphatase MutT (NUDIX family)
VEVERSLSSLRGQLATRVPARLRLGSRVLRPAAVLIPLQVRSGDLWVVLTERRKELRSHAGQISFPGGAVDAEDASPRAAALREAQEELGIRPADVEMLGPLDEYPTITRFNIHPFVGVIPHPYAFTPSEREVARVIELPFAAFRAPGVFREEPVPVPFLGRFATVITYQVGEHRVWGATAAIFKQLLDLVEGVG